MSRTSEVLPVGSTIATNVPSRLDRLQWCAWHWRIVIALGVTWILDGLEASLIANVASVLTEPTTLGLSAAQVGYANSAYLGGEIAGALLFGRLTDTFGRKKLFLVTLAVYLIGTALSGLAPNLAVFMLFRFIAGAGIGGEYAAINSAIDELIPAKMRGRVDLGINGSYWVGVALGAGMTRVLLNESYMPHALGWRMIFGLGAVLGVAIVLVRKAVPESPRWLLMRGRVGEAEEVMNKIETDVRAVAPGAIPPGEAPNVKVKVTQSVSFGYIARVLLQQHKKRTVLGLALMVSQTFFYDAIFFTFGLILTRFYNIPGGETGLYMIPFAAGNLFGPLMLGRLFDTVGRKKMITLTYALSGLLLLATGYAFNQGWLTAVTQTVCWCVVFFFASSAASSAFLTVSELFPVEIRGMTISLFFTVSKIAGMTAPTIFGKIIQTQSRPALFAGYAAAAVMMLFGALAAATLGVNAEGKSLEELAEDDHDKPGEPPARAAA